ncbi:hypothetical protein E2C01_047317 [Portunus trituberculatus]|uniref:Uncharacterized protein n=1 Tax=Portunus trituberculatus TaxID=210409 RepID=A0A5B7G786_PORTR|nr:hypothetical protein [Portunus trituberculatus]
MGRGPAWRLARLDRLEWCLRYKDDSSSSQEEITFDGSSGTTYMMTCCPTGVSWLLVASYAVLLNNAHRWSLVRSPKEEHKVCCGSFSYVTM